NDEYDDEHDEETERQRAEASSNEDDGGDDVDWAPANELLLEIQKHLVLRHLNTS
ncbi:unnamed protein product, partial [Aphanomyces euteiches]